MFGGSRRSRRIRTVRVSQEGGEERRLGFDLEIELCLFLVLTKCSAERGMFY
jgi:hypothetical protein